MSETRSPPLSEIEFRSFLNKVGEVVKPKDLRLAVYQRGADPAIRKVLWKHLLGIYPQGKSVFLLPHHVVYTHSVRQRGQAGFWLTVDILISP